MIDRSPDQPVRQLQDSWIRLFHAAPEAQAVDVYASGNLVARNLSFKGFSPYVPLRAGSYFINVFPTGQLINSMLQTTLLVMPNSATTNAIYGNTANLALVSVPEPSKSATRPFPNIRFVHLSPNTPTVNVLAADGSRLFTGLRYGRHTSYSGLRGNVYSFQIQDAANGRILLNMPNLSLAPGTLHTVYLVGLLGQEPPLQPVLTQDVAFG